MSTPRPALPLLALLLLACNLSASMRPSPAAPVATALLTTPAAPASTPAAPVPATPPALRSTTPLIGGIVWHDVCGADTTTCAGRGTLDAGETGIAGAVVLLYAGGCTPDPADALQRATTDAGGAYSFTVPSGDYCLTLNTTQPENVLALLPGAFTFPPDGVQRAAAQDGRTDVNFGWDYTLRP